MEPTQNETPSEAELAAAVTRLVGTLPGPLREFVESPERDATVMLLSDKYDLHVDQAEAFEKAFIYMLLGIFTPEQFVADLTNADIPQETIDGLVQDVNTEVFIPLRDAEREATQQPVQAPLVPAPAPLPVPSLIPAAPPAPSAPVAAMPAAPAALPTPLPQSPPPAPSVNVINTVAAVPQPAPGPVALPGTMPEVRTMAGDMAALQQPATTHNVYMGHNPAETTWHPAASVHVFVPGPQAPSVPTPVPVRDIPVAPPVMPQPTAASMPAPIASVPVPPAPAPTMSAAPRAPSAPATPLVKQYSADPYREPIE